jgi:hypothetical protein
MRSIIFAILLIIIAVVIGAFFQSPPYRLQHPYLPNDQAALDHRDSVYSSITWVTSQCDNFQQLRFFDRVEGGACLQPSWDEYDSLNQASKDHTLAHLVQPNDEAAAQKPGPRWTEGDTPNPGTLPHTRYVCLFPIGVLLNQHFAGPPREAAPRVLIVGLGSGIGVSVLAHHFPEASITVVDIDQIVVDMVRDHYPFLRDLETRKTATGMPRLRLVVQDARQFIRFQAKDESRDHPYDLVILDAYTSGSTIPPHLMTREFFQQIGDILHESGILLGNIIGSYTGEKHQVLGGAMRAMRAAGLTELRNFPIIELTRETTRNFDALQGRNNIVVASRKALQPALENARNFIPYNDLPLKKYSSHALYLGHSDSAGMPYQVSSLVSLDHVRDYEQIHPEVVKLLDSKFTKQASRGYASAKWSVDKSAMDQLRKLVVDNVETGDSTVPPGWKDNKDADCIVIRTIDWVMHARETYAASVTIGSGTEHNGEDLVGPLEGDERERQERSRSGGAWRISDAPLFTDAKPNADIYNMK